MAPPKKTGFSNLSNLASELSEGDKDVSANATIEKKTTTPTSSSIDPPGNTNDESETLHDPGPINSKSSSIQKIKLFLTKVIKWFFILIAGVCLLFWGINYWNDLNELRFNKNWINWEWYIKENRIQKSTNTKRTLLRRVYKKENYEIMAYKDDDYRLHATVKFIVPCNPGSEIVTSSQWIDGDPKILKCDKSGKYLSFGIMWKEKGTDVDWSENFEGFAFFENFKYWDFKILDQEITLSKAKKTTE